jgi:hypothetical protein
VEAPGVRARGPRRRLGEPARLRFLRAGAVLAIPEGREIYADASTKWRNPQAELLEGSQWEAIRPDALTALSLPDNPDALLAEHTRTLDAALKEVGGRLIANPDVRVDGAGKIHLTGVKAIEEPPSLVDLRARTTAMLPRVELPEAILEVMSWVPELAEAFTAVSSGRSRLKDLPISIAACLTAHSWSDITTSGYVRSADGG